LFLAGHETTAVALTWTLYHLSRHPDADERLGAELRALGSPARFEDLPRLPYAEAVVKESMRLHPPAWVVGRLAVEDLELVGTRVPRGATVLVSPWVMHRDARVFPEPERFAPERWLEGGPAQRLPRFCYLPFGAGPRACVGA